jgi:hypothetical protein
VSSSPGDPLSAPSEEEKTYFRTIEDRFCALRGAALLLSPKDWGLIASWWSQRVPLPLVLESLEEVFAARARRSEAADEIGSLAYVRTEVQRRFRLHRELVAVRRGEEEESARLRREIRLHLGRVARRLALAGGLARERGVEALARSLLIGSSEVRALKRSAGKVEWNPASAEERLEQIESEIMDSARSALSVEEREALKAQAREMLDSRGLRMTPEAYRMTLNSIEENLLRHRWSLPGIALLAEG